MGWYVAVMSENKHFLTHAYIISGGWVSWALLLSAHNNYANIPCKTCHSMAWMHTSWWCDDDDDDDAILWVKEKGKHLHSDLALVGLIARNVPIYSSSSTLNWSQCHLHDYCNFWELELECEPYSSDCGFAIRIQMEESKKQINEFIGHVLKFNEWKSPT